MTGFVPERSRGVPEYWNDGFRIMRSFLEIRARLISTLVLSAIILVQVVSGLESVYSAAAATGIKIIGADPEGRYLVEQRDGILNTWHIPSARLCWTAGEMDPVKKAIIDPTGQLVVTTHSRAHIQIRALADGTLLQSIDGAIGYKRINQIGFDAGGRFIMAKYGGIHIYSTSRDSVVRIWEAGSGKLHKEIRGLTSAAFDPQGRYVAGSKSSKGTRVVRTAAGFATVTEESKFEKMIGSTSDKKVLLWALDSGEVINTLSGHPEAIKKIYIAPKGRFILGFDYTGLVTIWSVDAAKPVKTVRISEKRLYKNDLKRIQLDDSGQYFTFRGMNAKTAKIWRLADGKAVVHIENPGNLKSIHFRASRSRVVSVSHSHVRTWSLDSGKMVGDFEMPYNDRLWIDSAGRQMIYTSSKQITSVNLETGSIDYALEGHQTRIFQLEYCQNGFAPDQPIIVSRSNDGWVLVWNPATGDLLNNRRFIASVQGQRLPWTYVSGVHIVGLDTHSVPVVWNIGTDALVALSP